MASRLRESKRVADFVRAQIAPKNNCHLVGVNLKTEHNVGNTGTVRKGTERISESGSANKKQTHVFLMPFSPRLNRTPYCL